MTAIPYRQVDAGFLTARTLRSTSRSHVGTVRVINEDRVFDCPARQIWAVADGMGGHQGGDIAAQSVVDALRDLTDKPDLIGIHDMMAALTDANAAIVARNSQLKLNSGSTVVAAMMDKGALRIAWAGDSRAYLIRAGSIEQLTRDHSLVQELIDAGLLSTEAAESHPQANVVTRALGVPNMSTLDTTSVYPEPGDRILLCSDGLSRSLRVDDVSPGIAVENLADVLIANSLSRDGSDNASLVILECSRD